MAPHQSEKQRQQIAGAVQPDPEHEAEPAAEDEIALAERSQIDERRRVPRAAP